MKIKYIYNFVDLDQHQFFCMTKDHAVSLV